MPLTSLRTDLFTAMSRGPRGGFVILRRDLTPAQLAEAQRVVNAAYPPEGYGTARRRYGSDDVIEWSDCE
jgi:hypothetical protein